MPVSKPRNRVIYFRVSEDEFQQLTWICESEGARSLSELARAAMQRAINGFKDIPDDPVAARLTRLDDLIGELEMRARQLDALIHERAGVNLSGKANAISA